MVALHSRKWTDNYPRGRHVECLLSFADGMRWVRCTVLFRTRSGLPVVTVDSSVSDAASGVTFRIDRKKNIREVSS